MGRLSLLLTLLLLATLLAGAQDLAWKRLWQTGEGAVAVGDWAVAAEVWRQVLTYGEWPFPRPREEVALREIDAWARVPDRAKADAALQTFLAQHPQDAWTDKARQRDTWFACQTGTDATVDRLSALLADGTLSGGALIAHLQGVIALQGSPTALQEALPRAHGGSPLRQWLVLSTVLEAAQDPEGACATFEGLSEFEARDPDAPALVTRVLRLYVATGQAARAQAAIDRLPDTLRKSPALKPVLAEVAKALPLQQTLRDTLPVRVAQRWEVGGGTVAEVEAWVAAVTNGIPGALPLLDDAVQAYLADRPLHPLRWTLERVLLERLLAAGFPARVAPRVAALLDEVAGTSAEAAVARLWGETLRAEGRLRPAAEHLVTVCAYPPTPKETLTLTLAVCRQADAPDLAAPLIRRMLKERPLTEEAMAAGYWACLRALARNDQPTAQAWADALTTAAPEHPNAVKARQRLRIAAQE